MNPALSHDPQPRGAAVRLADILQRAGLLDANGVRTALARLAAQGGWLGQHVVALGLADASHIADALAQATRTPRVVLARFTPEPMALARLDRAFCEEHRCVPLALRDGGASLVLAMVDPTDVVSLQKAVLRSGCSVRPVVATEAEIAAALRSQPAAGARPQRGISFDDTAPAAPFVTSVADSLTDSAPANDPSSLTPPRIQAAPGQGHELVEPDPSAELAQRLAAVELELRRTQQLVRALVGMALEKGLATREELAALAARPPSR